MPKVFEKFFKDNEELAVSEEVNPKMKNEDKEILGKIIKISRDGWGFISSKDIKFTRIFFHWTSLRQDTKKFQELKTGMKVTFIPVEVVDKGYRAIKIKVIE